MFGLDLIRKLKPCKWRYNQPFDDGAEHFGFIAQEVDEHLPHEQYGAVIVKDGVYYIAYQELIGPLVKAIQELDAKVTALEAQHG